MQPKKHDRPLDRLLAGAEMTQADLGRALGLTPAAVSRWHYIGIPRYAAAYLELAAEVNALRRKIAEAQKSPRS